MERGRIGPYPRRNAANSDTQEANGRGIIRLWSGQKTALNKNGRYFASLSRGFISLPVSANLYVLCVLKKLCKMQ